MTKSKAQEQVDEGTKSANIRMTKQRVEQIHSAIGDLTGKIERVRKQQAVLKDLEPKWFKKTNPNFEYENHPDFIALMKDLVLKGGDDEVKEMEDKLVQLKEGYARESVRLKLIEAGVPMSKIGDADIDKELQS